MKNDIQYEIYIGCRDGQIKEEIVSPEKLKETVADYFKKKRMNYSLLNIEGGYQNEDGIYIFENSLCITIIGDQNLDIVKFARSLSMYMNQECFLITRSALKMEYR